MKHYDYLLIGGGIAADSAARGIRKHDPNGTIGLFSAESDPPYNRPPLSKSLWKGMAIESINRGTGDFDVTLHLNNKVEKILPHQRRIHTEKGETFSYTKLLIATGGTPRQVPGDSAAAIYFRTLQDFRALSQLSQSSPHFTIIGGGFIAVEISAAFLSLQKQVDLIYPDDTLLNRSLPPELAVILTTWFQAQGAHLYPRTRVASIHGKQGNFLLRTIAQETIQAECVIAGLGIRPDSGLAQSAGLATYDGAILVDSHLATSDPTIYAAGDVITFPNPQLAALLHVEHEEHANLSGFIAGENMAGQSLEYNHLPMFYSSIGPMEIEGIGEVDPRLTVQLTWVEAGRSAVAVFLRDGSVRGLLLWNLPGQIANGRQLIGETYHPKLVELFHPHRPRRLVSLKIPR